MGWATNIVTRLKQQQVALSYKVLGEIEVFGKLLVANSPESPNAEFSKGLFRNSWFVGYNNFDPSVGTQPDKSGAGSLARIADIKTSGMFQTQDGYISFTNNVSYAARVEYLGWPKGEGSNGWVWSGRVGAYAPVRNSVVAWKAYRKV